MGNDKSEGSGNDKSEGSGCFKSITEKKPKFGYFWQCVSTINFFLCIDWAAIFCETVTEINLFYYTFEADLLFLGGKACIKKAA